METNLFFVYGTLKRGYGNNSILRDSEFIAEDRTTKRYLLANTGFPYAFPQWVLESYDFGDDLFLPVIGEVYRVTEPRVIFSLDSLEGEGHHYNRRSTETESGRLVYIYEQHEPTRLNHCRPCNIREGAWEWNM